MARAKPRMMGAVLRRGTTEHYEDPELYDTEYADQEDDIAWYCQLADDHLSAGSTLLELGAGTGRITIPVARHGHRIIALDRMPGMLALLRAKLEDPDLIGSTSVIGRDHAQASAAADQVECIEGDMLDLPFADASMRVVFAPFNVLMHLYTWRDLEACFAEVFRVLAPGGVFAFDILLPDIEWLNWDPNRRHGISRFEDPQTGKKMYYSTNHTYDAATQICYINIYYDPADGVSKASLHRRKTSKVVSLAHRQIFPEEARMLLTRAGFYIEDHSGEFLGLSLNADIECQNFVCRKPTD